MRVLPFILALLWTLQVPVLGSLELVGQSISDAMAEISLLNAVNDHFTGIEFGEGKDGFPTYRFLPTADAKTPATTILPKSLYEFAILITFLPTSLKGGFLFSVVNASVVQLGVQLSPVVKNSYNVSLLYTEANKTDSQTLASFSLSHVPSKWNSIAFQVLSDRVLFYYDCELRNTTEVVRKPIQLDFTMVSVLNFAQGANSENSGEKFEVSSGGCQFGFYVKLRMLLNNFRNAIGEGTCFQLPNI